ncbi:MAG: ArsR/SmtB family transcription factor [Nonlabens sp.]|uniref:ArsR/SmtB family transcription factor n=1 Tax=Nonlabens sp. TaxID=1888209 RepID=UPI003EF78EC5
MGTTKTEIFTAQQNQMAQMAKALGHPARIAIVQYLLQQDTCICGDLVTEIGLAQPTISQHLKALKNAGLIKGNIEGTSTCYCLNYENWDLMKSLLSPLLNLESDKTTNCC